MTYDLILWKAKRVQRDSDGLIALLLGEGLECDGVSRFPRSAMVEHLKEALEVPFDALPFEVSLSGKAAWFGLSHGNERGRHLQLIHDFARKNGLRLYDFQIEAPSPQDSAELKKRLAESTLSEEEHYFSDALASAEKGNANGMHKAGNYYRCGTGVEKDQNKAIEWYQRAGDAGLHKALVSLAEVYIQERGDPGSIEKGLALLRKGAALEHVPSITFLAELLRDGVGEHAPDLNEAIGLWQRLLVLDPWVGSFELAKLYESGQGVPQSTEKAIEYLKMARGAGHPEAYRNLRRLGAEP